MVAVGRADALSLLPDTVRTNMGDGLAQRAGPADVGGIALSATVESLSGESEAGGMALKVFDVSLVPDEPPEETLYQHKPRYAGSARELMRRWDVMFTLAERDIRAQYKQAVLGIAWALLVPLVSLAMLIVLAGHVKGFAPGGHVPFILWTYTRACWRGASSAGPSAAAPTPWCPTRHSWPRATSPVSASRMSQVLESAFSSADRHRAPGHPSSGSTRLSRPVGDALWAPLYLLVEIPFTLGLVFFVSSVIVHHARPAADRPHHHAPSHADHRAEAACSVEQHHKLHAELHYDRAGGRARLLRAQPDGRRSSATSATRSCSASGRSGTCSASALWARCSTWSPATSMFKRLEVNFADLT